MVMVNLLAIALPSVPTNVPSGIPALSVDAVIVAAVALVFLYGFIAGHAALIRESISIYVGLVLANNFGEVVYQYATKGAGANFPVNQTVVNLVLLLLPVLLLQFGRKSAHDKKHNIVATMVLAFLTAMLIVSSVLTQLDPATQSMTIDSAVLASFVYRLHLIWLGTVPIAIAASAFFKHSPHRKHKE